MSLLLRCRRSLGCRLLAIALLSVPCARLWAQTCPTGTVTITTPGPEARSLGGTVIIHWVDSWSGTTGWHLEAPKINIYPLNSNTPTLILDRVGQELDGTQYTNFDTWVRADGIYQVEVVETWQYGYGSSPPQCPIRSSKLTIVVGNPNTSRAVPEDKLPCACQCTNLVHTGSETNPLTGNQSWSIDVTSWMYKGKRYGLSLEYNSVSLVDPNSPPEPNFMGLSEKNCKWTHEWAQWISYYADETVTGAESAVWHRGIHSLSFQKSGSAYLSEGSFHTVTLLGSPVEVPSYPGAYQPSVRKTVPGGLSDYGRGRHAL
jgi:hypothetical protein